MRASVWSMAAFIVPLSLSAGVCEVSARSGDGSPKDAAIQVEADYCITWPEAEVPYGGVKLDTVRNWTDGVRYVVNPQYLRLINDASSKYGGVVLEQKMVPASNGTPRVLASIDVPASQVRVVTQSFRVDNGFDWGGQNESGKMGFGIGGGSVPTGGKLNTDGFSARLVWKGSNDGTARLGAYIYSADRSQNLPWGDLFLVPDFQIPQGEWFDVSLIVSANSSHGASDGWFAIILNDEVKLLQENVQWQSSGSPQPVSDRVMYASFYGGADSRWSPATTTTMRFANACYSRY